MDMQFTHLFTPLKSSTLMVKNRIFTPAITHTYKDLFDSYAMTREVKKISGNTLLLFNRIKDEKYTLEGKDNIVIVGISSPNDRTYFELKKFSTEVYRVGDCVAPRSIELAIWEGEEVGRRV